jgi:hypothetical protein
MRIIDHINSITNGIEELEEEHMTASDEFVAMADVRNAIEKLKTVFKRTKPHE